MSVETETKTAFGYNYTVGETYRALCIDAEPTKEPKTPGAKKLPVFKSLPPGFDLVGMVTFAECPEVPTKGLYYKIRLNIIHERSGRKFAFGTFLGKWEDAAS